VLRWTAAAEEGQFEIQREVGYVAGIATYVLAGELALGKHHAAAYAERHDTAACLANLCQAVLAAAQGRLAAAGEWILNEKRLVQRAGLRSVQDLLSQRDRDPSQLVGDVQALLAVADDVWEGE
jgi:hypothetical protein